MPLSQPTGNRMLDFVPASEFRHIAPHLSVVTLGQGEFVYRAGETLSVVYFPISCVLSAIATMSDGSSVEVGNVGLEGIGGIQAALAVSRVPSEMLCQVAGQAIAMDALAFTAAVERHVEFRTLALRYAQSLLNLVSQSVACNSLHILSERAARWLLMTRDRVGRDEFKLTQEFLAYMLGSRRSSVTVAAGMLQQAGLIQYRRGAIRILDPIGLEAASCECYRVIFTEFERLFERDAASDPDAA
ncbi:MAG TPA: Crp/Fnr family transcriptional regulator [Candidatus Acidoferrales bacterium]|jgi:CRP-like cAMP-binding protein|nr:Crp/Fnr family transcriptional regulator [Candidatus Acidoferrales bacterium]